MRRRKEHQQRQAPRKWLGHWSLATWVVHPKGPRHLRFARDDNLGNDDLPPVSHRRGRAPEARDVALQQVLAAFALEALVPARKPLDGLPHAVRVSRSIPHGRCWLPLILPTAESDVCACFFASADLTMLTIVSPACTARDLGQRRPLPRTGDALTTGGNTTD